MTSIVASQALVFRAVASERLADFGVVQRLPRTMIYVEFTPQGSFNKY